MKIQPYKIFICSTNTTHTYFMCKSCPPNQTKEEEVGNLPEKEFRILIVKMIQNLEIKMESQINRLETRIEKMQERFNKDLEEIKKSQNMFFFECAQFISSMSLLYLIHNPRSCDDTHELFIHVVTII